LCYEATADLPTGECSVATRVGDEKGRRISARVGIVPVLRGGLGMLEAMTEMVSNAKVYHLGIYRDKASLLPVEYYNKLPKRVDCDTVFVLDPCPISGSTAIAAMDILKAWGASKDAAADKHPRRSLQIKFVCICASEEAIENISSAHPDIPIHVGLIDRMCDAEGKPLTPILPGIGDISDRLFGTDGSPDADDTDMEDS